MTKSEFKTLFDAYFDPLRSYVYYRCGDHDVATDIAQDVFTRLWEKQFDISTPAIKGLLYKMAGDMFVNQYRRQKVSEKFANSLQIDLYDESPDETLEYTQLQQSYEKALTDLPEKQRIVFLMSRTEELTYNEIAARLDIGIKAVEKRMSKALKFLKQRLRVGEYAS